MGLLGILIGLGLLVWFAYHGWSVLVLAPAAALIAAAFSGEPLLAHWTQTFMGGAASFLAQFFPIFLLGAVFGRLMDDSGSISAIARFVTETMGTRHAIVAVVLAGALVTYGGVSLFVAFFVLAPMAEGLSAPPPYRADSCRRQSRLGRRPSPCRRFRARRRSRTRSQCFSSARPPLPRQASA
jgi:H+/gluconate symporter-like permease